LIFNILAQLKIGNNHSILGKISPLRSK